MNALAADRVPGKHLSCLLKGIHPVPGEDDVLIHDLCLDSRKVSNGSLFLAVPGDRQDGRHYIEQAFRAGASAVLFDKDGWTMSETSRRPTLGVSGLRRQIGCIADTFFDQPSSKFHVVGITGTNAKSTCASLTAQSLDRLGHRCGVIGTLGCGFPEQLSPSPLTTPDPVSLQRELAWLADERAEFVCLEVSSHSLDQSRNEGVRFKTVVFTNLTQDHLDYHHTMEHYRASKARLFTESNALCAVLNVDDEFGRSLNELAVAARKVTYGTGPAHVQLLDCVAGLEGLELTLRIAGDRIRVSSRLLGRFNGMNILSAAAVLHALEFSASEIEHGLEDLKPVLGRMERMDSAAGQPAVFVDYAHTPDGLETALNSLRELVGGRLWCVFGCGGNRDDDKRPIMGGVAERIADEVVITDDNPRDEHPQAIVKRILEGMQSQPKVIHERGEAIRFAIENAQPDDAVLIAGKGHEETQTQGDEVRQFSDRRVACEILESLA